MQGPGGLAQGEGEGEGGQNIIPDAFASGRLFRTVGPGVVWVVVEGHVINPPSNPDQLTWHPLNRPGRPVVGGFAMPWFGPRA